MATVIDRRQKREEKRSNSLERLNILSKVAARKDIARERLEKTAQEQIENNTESLNIILMERYRFFEFHGSEIMNLNSEFNKKTKDSKSKIIETMNETLRKYLAANKKAAMLLAKGFLSGINGGNFKDDQYEQILSKLRGRITKKLDVDGNKHDDKDYISFISLIATLGEIGKLYSNPQINLGGSNSRADESNQSAKKQTPPPTRKAPATDPTARMRTLLNSIGINPGNGAGWDPQFNTAFETAYNQWKKYPQNQNAPDISKGWQAIAPVLGLTGDIAGATDLVETLVALKGNPVATPAPATPAPATPAPAPVDNTAGAKAKLTQLFDMILSGSTKVDRVGIDLRNDTKIFKGVIIGLGGARKAVEYVFSEVQFIPEQLDELTRMNFNSNQKIAINALSPVRNLFVDIRKESTRGIRNNAFNAASLSRAVERWLAVQPKPAATPAAAATPPTQSVAASIRKSIEIRKMAARKKLGF